MGERVRAATLLLPLWATSPKGLSNRTASIRPYRYLTSVPSGVMALRELDRALGYGCHAHAFQSYCETYSPTP